MYTVTLTPAAIEKVKELRDRERCFDKHLRLSVQGGGCSGFNYAMSFDFESTRDKSFLFDGLCVLVDCVSIMYLDGVILDYAETLTDSGFKFNNPNAKRTCGCGSSFSA